MLSLGQEVLKLLDTSTLKHCRANLRTKNQEEDEIWKKTQSQNNRILINQLHYCRFLYYLIKNSQHVLANGKATSKLNVVIFKHIIKLIKKLADKSFNWLKLKEWDIFKTTKKYTYTLQTLKEYLNRYERQYITYIKNIPVQLIREVNKEFPQLSSNSEFSVEVYGKLLKYLRPLIRQTNHNLGVILSKCSLTLQRSICRDRGVEVHFQILSISGNKYIKFENYQHFQENSQIKVNVDYVKVRSNSLSRFMELRNQIKSI